MKITKSQLKKLIKEELHKRKKWPGPGVAFWMPKAAKTRMTGGWAFPGSMAGMRAKEWYEENKEKMDQHLARDRARLKEIVISEDGHEDVPSARRAMQTIIEDAEQMLQALEQMDGSLPTWWTNKMAVASSNLNKMRDYLLVDGGE